MGSLVRVSISIIFLFIQFLHSPIVAQQTSIGQHSKHHGKHPHKHSQPRVVSPGPQYVMKPPPFVEPPFQKPPPLAETPLPSPFVFRKPPPFVEPPLTKSPPFVEPTFPKPTPFIEPPLRTPFLFGRPPPYVETPLMKPPHFAEPLFRSPFVFPKPSRPDQQTRILRKPPPLMVDTPSPTFIFPSMPPLPPKSFKKSEPLSSSKTPSPPIIKPSPPIGSHKPHSSVHQIPSPPIMIKYPPIAKSQIPLPKRLPLSKSLIIEAPMLPPKPSPIFQVVKPPVSPPYNSIEP